LTNANAYTEFFSREVAVLVNYIIMQMDKRVHARLDIDAFMKSLSFEINGTRRTARPWIHGPGWRPEGASNEIDQEGELTGPLESTGPLRARVMKELGSRQKYLAQFLPHQVGSKKIDPLSQSDIKDLKEKDDSRDEGHVQGNMTSFSVDARMKQGIRVLLDLHNAQHENDEEIDTALLEDNEKDIEQFHADDEFNELVDTYGNTKVVRDAEANKAAKAIAKSKKRKRNNTEGCSEDEGPIASTSNHKKRNRRTRNPRMSVRITAANFDLESVRGFSPESEESFGNDVQHDAPDAPGHWHLPFAHAPPRELDVSMANCGSMRLDISQDVDETTLDFPYGHEPPNELRVSVSNCDSMRLDIPQDVGVSVPNFSSMHGVDEIEVPQDVDNINGDYTKLLDKFDTKEHLI